MAAPTKPTPVLENFYDIKQACDRLNLSDPEDPDDKSGQKWLRDGVNRKTNPFPHTRLAGRLRFSDSDLIVITRMAREEESRRGKTRPASPTRRKANAARRRATAERHAAEAERLTDTPAA